MYCLLIRILQNCRGEKKGCEKACRCYVSNLKDWVSLLKSIPHLTMLVALNCVASHCSTGEGAMCNVQDDLKSELMLMFWITVRHVLRLPEGMSQGAPGPLRRYRRLDTMATILDMAHTSYVIPDTYDMAQRNGT